MREPLEVRVLLRSDDEVLRLRARVAELESALADMTTQRNRVEYLYRCETLINTELHDLCKANGVKVRPALFRRPWAAEQEGGSPGDGPEAKTPKAGGAEA